MNKPNGPMKKSLRFLTIWCVSIMCLLAMPVAAVVSSPPAWAQAWTWPWETETRGTPAERPNPRYQPRYEPPQNSRGNTYDDPRQPSGGRSGSICLELEQQLARYANGTANRAQQIAELTRQIRESRGKLRNTQIQLDRQDCYETFLFSRTLRRTRTCFNLDRSAIQIEREIQELELRYQQMQSTTARSHQDDIIRELARNNCGDTYVQEARRRNPMRSFWQDEDTPEDRIRGNTFGGLPFATYRTLCVRLCDGYYFPVSFSTLPTHFTRDADACQSRCAAPAELYFHQNPGGSVAEMVSQKSQEPYKSLPTAFRYRKEYVAGCSCKQAEYMPGNDGTAPRQSGTTQPHQSPGAASDPPKRSALSPMR